MPPAFATSFGVDVDYSCSHADARSLLPQALLRPGRFDRQISIDRPDLNGRDQIFKVHLAAIKLDQPVEYYSERMAALTPGAPQSHCPASILVRTCRILRLCEMRVAIAWLATACNYSMLLKTPFCLPTKFRCRAAHCCPKFIAAGFAGADIANVCNEAALFAARSSKEAVTMVDFENAVDRIIGGLEKKNKVVSSRTALWVASPCLCL